LDRQVTKERETDIAECSMPALHIPKLIICLERNVRKIYYMNLVCIVIDCANANMYAQFRGVCKFGADILSYLRQIIRIQ